MAEQTSTINLRILSPSTEVEGGITFTDIPAATTIRELRSRVQDAVPSKPAPERMRLIYRGRVVANDADTLGNVFGADNLRESKDQSLHLVLRELPPSSSASPSPVPRSATAPPNPFRPAQAPMPASPPLQTNPFRTLAQPRPNSQPQAPPPHYHPHHPHAHAHHHHHHVAGPPNPFQIPLPPAIQQQLAQTMNMAQNAQLNPGQIPHAQGQPSREGTPAPENGAPAQPMGLPPLPGFGPGPPALPANGRTVRQEGIGPNGERWSVTYSSTNLPVAGGVPNLPRPFHPQPPALGLPPRPGGSPAPTEAIDRLLPRMRHILQSARQEMENVTTLLLASGHQAGETNPSSATNPPPWRLERIRQHVQLMGRNLNMVENGLVVIAADASMTDNPDVVLLRQDAHALRGQLDAMNRTIAQLEEVNRTTGQRGDDAPAPAPPAESAPSSTQPGAPTTVPTTSATFPPGTAQLASQTLPPGAPEELFILSSPQGPVGILFDQRGTYATAPLVPTLPFQTFTNQFAHNRQLISGLGQQIAHGSNSLHNQLASIQPTPTQQPTATGQGQNQAQPQAPGAEQGQAQNQGQAQAQNANPPADPQAGNDRVGNLAGHVWLLFKLACFVYFFSGGGGWYKSLVLGLIAGGIYLAQLGLFDEHFAVVRHHFEAVLPVGALAERAAQPRRAETNRNMTPEEAARRLLQQQRDQRFAWIRESMRTVERSFAIFVASLWPGIGERMVHAQEERVRLERVAEEEERQRQIEEAQRQEQETKEEEEKEKKKDEPAVDAADDANGAGSSAKGKERADVPDAEAELSGEMSGAAS